ncbi:MAG: NAD(P)H-dependent oxidoreductase [Pyrinomonadaceae bacterium]|nr:NAD(P)H-dependent oxidoreductase [Pyrinomonadaceae bacterium]
MSKNPKILAFAGSLREKSYNRRVLKTAIRGAEAAGALVTEIDLGDYPMPIYNADIQEKEGFPENAEKLQKLLLEHDGLLIASPEYNASLPAALKNAIDWTSRANGDIKLGQTFKGNVAAIMTASPGAFGGIRCLGHLRDVLTILLVNTLPTEIAVGKVHEMFDGDGAEMTDEKMKGILENLGKSLADTLRKTHDEVEVVKSATSDINNKQ